MPSLDQQSVKSLSSKNIATVMVDLKINTDLQ